MFPFLIADGWAYKGFGIARDDGQNVINFRFEKTVMGRAAFAILHVYAKTLNAPGYDLKAWMLCKLREEEESLTRKFQSEFAGAA